jgi:hypothetical protein
MPYRSRATEKRTKHGKKETGTSRPSKCTEGAQLHDCSVKYSPKPPLPTGFEPDLNCMIYQLNGVLMQSRMKSFWYVKYTKAKNVIHFKIAIWKKTDSSQ